MKVKVLKIENGAEYEGNVFDCWIEMQTNTGKILKVFDSTPFDLRGLENKEIDVVLLAGFIQNQGNNTQELLGEVFESPLVENIEWTKQKSSLFQNKWNSIKTDYGNILIDSDDMLSIKINEGDKCSLHCGRIDILAYKQV